MKTDRPRLVEECHLICESKRLHFRSLFDGEDYSYDPHGMQLTAWRLMLRSVPATHHLWPGGASL